MRKCRKCGKDFKMGKRIDGKYRNLAGRKFCLECSPFGSKNTKPDDPARPSVPHARNGLKYCDWPQEQKTKYLKRYYNRQVQRKEEIVALKGGKCSKCGYSKCIRALEFHHREPSEKEFSLTARELAGFAWETILKEAAKCDLLCANCHREIEDETSRSKYSDKWDQQDSNL